MGKKVSVEKVVLKEITENDLPGIARVHIDSFPESVLTNLGAPIVRRYYFWQLTGPHKKVRAVGAFIDDDCVGFSFSGEFNGSTSGFIERNKSFLVKEVLLHPWLLLNRFYLSRILSGVNILRRFRKKQTKKTEDAKDKAAAPPSFGILSIAVARDRQHLGIGKMLMLDAEDEAVRCGYKRMHLTVSTSNEKAIRFYEKLSWQKLLQGELWKGAMIKKLV